jgi:hypothetical protein
VDSRGCAPAGIEFRRCLALMQRVITGKTSDVTFSKFMSLSIGTPYVEMGKLQQRDRNEK